MKKVIILKFPERTTVVYCQNDGLILEKEFIESYGHLKHFYKILTKHHGWLLYEPQLFSKLVEDYLKDNFNIDNIKHCLETRYEDEYFVNLTTGDLATRDVLSTNFCKIAVFPARSFNQVIIVSVIDNLVKGRR